MEVAEGTRAPMESRLFTDQCVYLSRKHLLWSGKASFGLLEVSGFADQGHAEEYKIFTSAGPGSEETCC